MSSGSALAEVTSSSVSKSRCVRRHALIYLKVLVKMAQCRNSRLFSPMLFSRSTRTHHFFLASASKYSSLNGSKALG